MGEARLRTGERRTSEIRSPWTATHAYKIAVGSFSNWPPAEQHKPTGTCSRTQIPSTPVRVFAARTQKTSKLNLWQAVGPPALRTRSTRGSTQTGNISPDHENSGRLANPKETRTLQNHARLISHNSMKDCSTIAKPQHRQQERCSILLSGPTKLDAAEHMRSVPFWLIPSACHLEEKRFLYGVEGG